MQYSQYHAQRTLAEMLVEHDIPSELLAECVINSISDGTINEEQLYNELLRNILGGISNVARGAAGVGNMFRAGGNAVGRGVGAVGNAVGNAAMSGARAVGNAAMSGAQAVGNAGKAVGNAVGQAGQHMGNLYQQGQQKETLKQALNSIQGLNDQLTSAGLPPGYLQKIFPPLQRAIQQYMQRVEADPNFRVQNAKVSWQDGAGRGYHPAQPQAAPPVAAAG